jgi:hypothetical protein
MVFAMHFFTYNNLSLTCVVTNYSELNNSAAMVVSPAQPAFYQYQFPPDVWSVVVHAVDNSTDNICAVFSVQEAKVF